MNLSGGAEIPRSPGGGLRSGIWRASISGPDVATGLWNRLPH